MTFRELVTVMFAGFFAIAVLVFSLSVIGGDADKLIEAAALSFIL